MPLDIQANPASYAEKALLRSARALPSEVAAGNGDVAVCRRPPVMGEAVSITISEEAQNLIGRGVDEHRPAGPIKTKQMHGNSLNSADADKNYSYERSVVRRMNSSNMSEARTLANGDVIHIDRSRVKNEDGSITVSQIKTLPNGKTVARQKTITENDDGSLDIAGSVTGAKGKVRHFAGTQINSENGSDRSMIITKANGDTSVREVATQKMDGMNIRSIHGVKFDGTNFTFTVAQSKYFI